MAHRFCAFRVLERWRSDWLEQIHLDCRSNFEERKRKTMSEPECKKCGRPYMLTHGDEPTPYCDACAHVRVEELERELMEANSKLSKLSRMIEIAGHANDAASEAEVANSATFLEAMAHTNTEMVEAERDQLRAEVLVWKSQFNSTKGDHDRILKLQTELKEARVVENLADIEMRNIVMVCGGNDPSEGEGTTYEQVSALVIRTVKELRSELEKKEIQFKELINQRNQLLKLKTMTLERYLTEAQKEIANDRDQWRAVAGVLFLALANDGVFTNNSLSDYARSSAISEYKKQKAVK